MDTCSASKNRGNGNEFDDRRLLFVVALDVCGARLEGLYRNRIRTSTFGVAIVRGDLRLLMLGNSVREVV
jgi:hypothetical protein